MVSFTYAWMDSNSQTFYFRTSQILDQFCACCTHSINLTQNRVTSTCTCMFHLCNCLVDLNEVWFGVVHKESWISFFPTSLSHNHCFIYLQHTTDFSQKLITVQKREQGKLTWVLEFLGIPNTELAKQVEIPFVWLGPVCGRSLGVVRQTLQETAGA